MLLLLDLGNTNLSVGVYQDRKPICLFKTHTDKLKTESEYQELLAQFLLYHQLPLNLFQGAILSSVVPSLTMKISKAVEGLLNKTCLIVSKNIRSGMAIRLDNPAELGADLISGAVGAIDDYQEDCLVVDMGTAVKLYIATAKKEYLGGAIIPGMRISADCLFSKAALLTDVELSLTDKFIGKNSHDSLNVGIVLGWKEMIEGLADKMEKEYGKPLKKILTGGDSELLKDVLSPDFTYNPNVVMDGLYDIYLRNTVVKKE